MSADLTTKLAREAGLPGSDVFRRTHLMYHDDINRDASVVHLNLEAFKAFFDTITIGRRTELAAEQEMIQDWKARGGFESGISFPWGRASHDWMEFYNYENLKIASAFELHLKARLVAADYIVHEIDSRQPHCKKLAKEQHSMPIRKEQLFALSEYHFDGNLNYLPGLKESSLKFSTILETQKYVEALRLPELIVAIVREYRHLRNTIHLPGDHPPTPVLASLSRPLVDILLEFIDSDIINSSKS